MISELLFIFFTYKLDNTAFNFLLLMTFGP